MSVEKEAKEDTSAKKAEQRRPAAAPSGLSTARKYVKFGGRVVMLGCGGLGRGVLPLLFRHVVMYPSQVVILTSSQHGSDVAEELGVEFRVTPITKENYQSVLAPLLRHGDFLLNLSIDVSCVDLIKLACERGALYLDTSTEPWVGGYSDHKLPVYERSCYGFREAVLECKRALPEGSPTALVTNGANPGLVSYFLKAALLEIARDTGHAVPPREQLGKREAWGELARSLGVKTVHIAERDTQVSAGRPKEVGEFVNTWSVDGFMDEGMQPSELGWGTHERHFPPTGRTHDRGCGAAIMLLQPGMQTRVRSWTPSEGPQHGFLMTHSESISIADYLTVRDPKGAVLYRPTVHSATNPCDQAFLSAHELVGKNFRSQDRKRILMEDITHGMDELGVLVMGHERGAFWYGSQLSIEEARFLCPYNNATTLQVTASILAGFCWCLENPKRGVVEPDEVDFQYMLSIARPYLGKIIGVYTDWSPLQGRNFPFPEDIDPSDPWQFKNFRV